MNYLDALNLPMRALRKAEKGAEENSQALKERLLKDWNGIRSAECEDIRNLLSNISMSTGLSSEQIEGCVDYVAVLIEKARLDEVRYWHGVLSKPFIDGDSRLREVKGMAEDRIKELEQTESKEN